MMQPTSVESEREKYRRMWTEVPAYRGKSPGEQLVDHFLTKATWQKGDTLVDAGCGPGRAALKLAEHGFDVTLMDITPEAPDKHARGLPFIEACLWSEREWPVFDWVYCCDVLEHIPPEHVDATIKNLAAMTRKGAFMQIAMWKDGCGQRIGATLHLTVENADWWTPRINKHFAIMGRHQTGDGRLIVLCNKDENYLRKYGQ